MSRRLQPIVDGYRALRVELIYRKSGGGRWIRTGRGHNWRQYRLWGHWHIKIVWAPRTLPNR